MLVELLVEKDAGMLPLRAMLLLHLGGSTGS